MLDACVRYGQLPVLGGASGNAAAGTATAVSVRPVARRHRAASAEVTKPSASGPPGGQAEFLLFIPALRSSSTAGGADTPVLENVKPLATPKGPNPPEFHVGGAGTGDSHSPLRVTEGVFSLASPPGSSEAVLRVRATLTSSDDVDVPAFENRWASGVPVPRDGGADLSRTMPGVQQRANNMAPEIIPGLRRPMSSAGLVNRGSAFSADSGRSASTSAVPMEPPARGRKVTAAPLVNSDTDFLARVAAAETAAAEADRQRQRMHEADSPTVFAPVDSPSPTLLADVRSAKEEAALRAREAELALHVAATAAEEASRARTAESVRARHPVSVSPSAQLCIMAAAQVAAAEDALRSAKVAAAAAMAVRPAMMVQVAGCCTVNAALCTAAGLVL